MSLSSPTPRVRGDPVRADQGSRRRVLRGQRVGRRQVHLGAAGREGPHQVGGLGGDVEACADAQAREGLLALEPRADQAQHGHLALGPLDAPDALLGEREVGHVMRDVGGGVGHGSSSVVAPAPGGAGAGWDGLGGLACTGWAWSDGRRFRGPRTDAGEQAPERGGEVRPRGAGPPGEALLEPAVLLVAQPAVGSDGGRVVGADVEHDLVTGPEQFGGHGAGRGLGIAATAVVGMGEHVADDREARLTTDHVRAGRGDQPAVDPDPVVDTLPDGRGRQPRGEAQLVEAVQLVDLHREQPVNARHHGLEGAPVNPHPDHLRAGLHPVVLGHGGQRFRLRGRRTRPAAARRPAGWRRCRRARRSRTSAAA